MYVLVTARGPNLAKGEGPCRSEFIEEAPVAKFQVYKDRVGEYRWRLRASGNNEIIADSAEGYREKRDCLGGIDLVKEQAPDAEVDEQD